MWNQDLGVLNTIVFSISAVSGTLIILLSGVSHFRSSFEFYPPPSKASWQYLLFWSLFRLMFAGVVVLCVTTYNTAPFLGQILRFVVWLPLAISGFGVATYLSLYLGWENAHGEAKGLKVSGCYEWSRNPIYVSSFVGMVGLGFFINSGQIYVLLSLWAGMYFAAISLEEKWMEKKYGAAFLSYKAQVPRFFGIPQKDQ